MRITSSATQEFPEDTLVMLSFHFLFMRKPTPACPLLASEWYSRWPLWRVVKLSSFLRTSPSSITLVSCCFLSVLLPVLALVYILVMFLNCMLRSSVDPNHLLGHRIHADWDWRPWLICTLHAGFHGLPFHAGPCGLEGGTKIGVPSLGSCVSALKGSTCPGT